MNFIKKIIGFGGQQQGEDIDQIAKELWKEFEESQVIGSVYRYDRKTNKKEVLYKRANISFDYDTNQDFEYFIFIEQNSNEKKSKNDDDGQYFLPVKFENEFKYFISKRESKDLVFDYINIEFYLDENSTIRIMINITHEGDKIDGVLFLEQLSKLVYQNKYCKSYKLSKDREYSDMIQLIEKGTMQTGSEISSISSYQDHQDDQSNFSSGISQQQNQQVQKKKTNYPDLEDINQKMDKMSINDKINQQQQNQQQQYSQQSQQSQQEQKISQNRNPEESTNKVKLDDDKLQKVLLNQIQKDEVTCAYTGKYCLIDKSINQPALIDYVVFTITKGDSDFSFRMNVFNQENKRIYAQNIDKELNYRIDIQDNFIKWVYYNEKSNFGEVLCILFDKPGQALTLSFQFNQALYEIKNKCSLQDTFKKQEDMEFMSNYMQNEDDLNRNDKFQEDIVQQYDDGLSYNGQSQPTYYVQNENQSEEGRVAMDQGRILDRTFVSKQGIIGIYKTDNQNQCNLSYETQMPALTDLQGNKLDPVKLQMMQQDEKMIVVNNFNDTSCYQLDLAKGGKIIRELKIDGINTISDICMDKKHQELTQDQIFNACNSKNLFKLDPRIKDAKIAEIVKDHKHYATNNGFTCLTTNKGGNVAVGSDNGDIRLYNGIGKQAKNKYPGFGDPITHIETTKDGRWVLATCKNYLILLPTFGKNSQSDNNDQTGYTKQMKYDERKLPRKLKILPDDQVKYGIKQVEFSAARFDEKQNGKEQFIVAGTGKYCVVWSFASILRGDQFDYRIAPYHDNIEDIQFKFNSEQYIFAAMNKNIQLGLTSKQKYGKN